MVRVIIFVADGFEEIELIVPFDLLSRAGAEVLICSINPWTSLYGAHQLQIGAQNLLEEFSNLGIFDCIILPGGMPGSKNLSESAELIEIIKNQFERRKLIAAICAAPALVLTKAGILENLQSTCYPDPDLEKRIIQSGSKLVTNEDVVHDKNVITARGPGVAHKFAFEIIKTLFNEEHAEKLKKSCLY